MHLKITKKEYKGKIYRHALIVETYRRAGKIKQRIILNVGPIRSDEDKRYAKEMLESLKQGEKGAELRSFKLRRCVPAGLLLTCKNYLKKLKFSEIFQDVINSRMKIDSFQLITYLIANRFIEPNSDLSFVRWIKSLGMKFDDNQIYRFLTLLYKNKEKIENKIFEVLKERKYIKSKLIFYDLTSTYFESSVNEIVKYGYSRDKKKDKKQIVIGVVLIDNLPVATYVFSGNTQDKETLSKVINEIKQRFQIHECITVCDRGIISVGNIEEVEKLGFNYIIATQRRKVPKFIKEMFKKKNYFEKLHEGRRYILIINEERRKEELKKLQNLKKSIEFALKKENSIKQLVEKFGKACRLIDFKKKIFDKKSFTYEKLIAGKYILVTTTSLPPQELEAKYKELQEVERFFRELKSLVKVRPVWHKKKENIISHVFICSLSLLFKRLLKKEDVDVEKLRRIMGAEISIRDRSYILMEKLEDEELIIFKKLGIYYPVIVSTPI